MTFSAALLQDRPNQNRQSKRFEFIVAYLRVYRREVLPLSFLRYFPQADILLGYFKYGAALSTL